MSTNLLPTVIDRPMVVDTLTRYNSQLPTPLDLDRFISTGDNRKPFYGAFQPRLGFAFAVDKASKTTIFGGFGIYYDRSLFDIAVDETERVHRVERIADLEGDLRHCLGRKPFPAIHRRAQDFG